MILLTVIIELRTTWNKARDSVTITVTNTNLIFS